MTCDKFTKRLLIVHPQPTDDGLVRVLVFGVHEARLGQDCEAQAGDPRRRVLYSWCVHPTSIIDGVATSSRSQMRSGRPEANGAVLVRDAVDAQPTTVEVVADLSVLAGVLADGPPGAL